MCLCICVCFIQKFLGKDASVAHSPSIVKTGLGDIILSRTDLSDLDGQWGALNLVKRVKFGLHPKVLIVQALTSLLCCQ